MNNNLIWPPRRCLCLLLSNLFHSLYKLSQTLSGFLPINLTRSHIEHQFLPSLAVGPDRRGEGDRKRVFASGIERWALSVERLRLSPSFRFWTSTMLSPLLSPHQ